MTELLCDKKMYLRDVLKKRSEILKMVANKPLIDWSRARRALTHIIVTNESTKIMRVRAPLSLPYWNEQTHSQEQAPQKWAKQRYCNITQQERNPTFFPIATIEKSVYEQHFPLDKRDKIEQLCEMVTRDELNEVCLQKWLTTSITSRLEPLMCDGQIATEKCTTPILYNRVPKILIKMQNPLIDLQIPTSYEEMSAHQPTNDPAKRRESPKHPRPEPIQQDAFDENCCHHDDHQGIFNVHE